MPTEAVIETVPLKDDHIYVVKTQYADVDVSGLAEHLRESGVTGGFIVILKHGDSLSSVSREEMIKMWNEADAS